MNWSEFFTGAWLWWIALTILSFLILEGFAFYKNGKGYTLSEHVWKWFAVRDVNAKDNNMVNPQPTTWVIRGRRLLLLNLFAWPVLHFFTGGFF